jgi:hypothetical protein
VPGFRQLISWFFAILPGFHGLAVHLPTAKPGLAAKAEQNFFHLVCCVEFAEHGGNLVLDCRGERDRRRATALLPKL